MRCLNCLREIIPETQLGYIHLDGTWACGKDLGNAKAIPERTLAVVAEAVTEAQEGHAGKPCPECYVYYGEHMTNCSRFVAEGKTNA